MWRKKLDKMARREEVTAVFTRWWLVVKGVLMTPWRVFVYLCFSLGLLVLGCTVALGLLVSSFLGSLPKLDKMDFGALQAQATKRIHERAIDRRYKHKWVALKDVSRDYLYAVVLSEDSTFFEHDGFNFEAIADSLAENIRERKTAYGGSTISQQVVKNLFLDSEKTLTRKLRELLITRDLERHFSKNEILEIYFNIADFGPELFGVGAAAKHFFGKAPSDVNAAEGAFIALMLPSPKRNYYAIYENQNLSRQRRRRLERVLRDMLYEEYISEADYRKFVGYDYFSKMPGRGLAKSRRDP